MKRKYRSLSIIASILLAMVVLATSLPPPVQAEGISYAYDDNGNLLTKVSAAENVTYSYDYENQLIEVTTSGTSVAYSYDTDGIRIQKTVDATDITGYLVDQNRPYAQVLEERDGSDSLQVSYIYGDDLISQERGGVDSYYHYDGQLSTRALSDSTETVTDTYTYDAFGNLLAQTGTTENNYLYTGEQYDANAGFYYLRARYYDTGVGRFITTDPWSGSAYDPASLHKYLYAGADPVNNWDPSGMMSIPEVNIVSAVSATLNNFTRIAFAPILQMATNPSLSTRFITIQTLAYTRAQTFHRIFSGQGFGGVKILQEAYQMFSGVITESQAAAAPSYSNHQAMTSGLNQTLFGTTINPDWPWHHFVQQATANLMQFNHRAIYSVVNVVPIPRHLHTMITSYQVQGHAYHAWLPPQFSTYTKWVVTQDWETQWRIGHEMYLYVIQHQTLNGYVPSVVIP